MLRKVGILGLAIAIVALVLPIVSHGQISQPDYMSGHWKYQGVQNEFDRASHVEFHLEGASGNTLVQEQVFDQAALQIPAGTRQRGLFYQRVGERVFQGNDQHHTYTLMFDGNIVIRTADDGTRAYFRRQ